jgi:hypothetical protein
VIAVRCLAVRSMDSRSLAQSGSPVPSVVLRHAARRTPWAPRALSKSATLSLFGVPVPRSQRFTLECDV